MEEGPDNLVLAYLRRIDSKVDRAPLDISELRGRVGNVEGTLAQHTLMFGSIDVRMAEMSVRLDRIDARLTRV